MGAFIQNLVKQTATGVDLGLSGLLLCEFGLLELYNQATLGIDHVGSAAEKAWIAVWHRVWVGAPVPAVIPGRGRQACRAAQSGPPVAPPKAIAARGERCIWV